MNEFPFDMADVEEDIDSVLTFFDFHTSGLDQDEKDVLTNDLLELARASELAEVHRNISVSENYELNWLGQMVYPEFFTKRKIPKSVSVSGWLKQLGLSAGYRFGREVYKAGLLGH